MSQELVFEFMGTKEDFLNKLANFPNNDHQMYYFDNYIVKIVGEEIHFGVERAGHSNGYWYIPKITQHNGKTQFRGNIKYTGAQAEVPPAVKRSFSKRFIGKIIRGIFYILTLPLVLAVLLGTKLYNAFKGIKGKAQHQLTAQTKTKEEKLIYLMEKHLGCSRV